MASGDTLCIFTPLHAEVPATLYALIGVRNNHPILAFDGTTAWSAFFTTEMPANYGGGGVTVRIWWSAASATTGAVVWGVSMEDMSATDLDSDSFATQVVAGATTTNATSGVLSVTSVALTSGAQMDNTAAGDAFRLRVERLPANAGDTMAGNAEIMLIDISET